MTKITISTDNPKGLKLATLLRHARAELLKRCSRKVDDPRPYRRISLRKNIKIMGRLGRNMERADPHAKAFKPLGCNSRKQRYFESISLKAGAAARILFGLQ